MHYVIKFAILLYLLIGLIVSATLKPVDIIIILVLSSLTLLIHQVKKGFILYVLLAQWAVLLYASLIGDIVVHLLPLMIFDIAYEKRYYGLVPTLVLIYLVGMDTFNITVIGFYIMVAVSAFLLRTISDRKAEYNHVLDNERRIRYDLERVSNQLIRSNQEIENLTKVAVQNRIARDLHDGIGHLTAGIVMQLQAAETLLETESGQQKGRIIISNCVKALQNMIETIRDTVHNMYKEVEVTPEMIQQVMDDFKFCPITYEVKGDIARMPKHYYEGVVYILKEALTNVSKHSNATRVNVTLSISYTLVRLVIKDDRTVKMQIEEGLGLRSMRDRARQMSGHLVYDNETGMQIVCTLPIMKES